MSRRSTRHAARTSPIRHGAGPVRFTIRADEAPFHEALRFFFGSFGPPPARASGSLRYEVGGGAVSRGAARLGRVDGPIEAAQRIVLDLGERVAEAAKGWVCLHAGAFSWRGRGLILPAPLKGGKSTLTLGMVRKGCTYYSDDIAMIDCGDARLTAFPRPIDLRGGAADLFRRLGPGLTPLRSPGGGDRTSVRVDRRRTGRARARVRWIVFPHVRLGRPTVLSPLPRGEALVRLSGLSFNLHRRGKGGFEALVSLVQGAECYGLEVGRLRDGLRALGRLTGRG